MVHPQTYFDPTGARTPEDFLQLTRIGLADALNSFDGTKGATLLSWIRTKMEQILIKEVRKMNKVGFTRKISLDSSLYPNGDLMEVENLIYEQLFSSSQFNEHDFNWSDETYWQVIHKTRELLQGNRQVLRVFNTKMAFPMLTRSTLSELLNTSKSTLSQYFKQIRSCIKKASDLIADGTSTPLADEEI